MTLLTFLLIYELVYCFTWILQKITTFRIQHLPAFALDEKHKESLWPNFENTIEI